MATKIVTKNSSTASAVPTASDLVQGELAVNVADKRLFTEDNGGSIVELGTNPSTLAVDTDTLYVDSTNNRVGIGTASPTRDLHIHNTTQPYFHMTSGDTGSTATDGFSIIVEDNTNDVIFNQRENADIRTFVNGTERMRIDSSGNVGIGTTSPSEELELASSSPTIRLTDTNDSTYGSVSYNVNALMLNGDNTIRCSTDGTERMRIDSSGKVGIGTTSADEALEVSGDVKSSGGNFGIYHFGETSDVTKIVGRDASHGSFPNTMDFFTNSSERMRIDASGQVGIGTSSPTARLQVSYLANLSEASPHFRIQGAGYQGYHWLDGTAYYIGQNSVARRVRIYSGAESSGVNLNANATSWGTFSDERLKYDVEPVENAVESLSNLRTVKYRLKDVDSAEDKKKIGLMAQDLVGVLDEVIDPVKKTGDDTEYMSVRYTELVPVLVKAIQEQQTLIESLTARIAALEE